MVFLSTKKWRVNVMKYAFAVLINLMVVLHVVATPPTLSPISAPEVKGIMQSDPNTLLIHTLSSIEFQIQHLPGSINIPTNKIATTKLLPADKKISLIFYCMGKRCIYSYNAAIKAKERGYLNINWFQGGIPEWRRYDYPMEVNQTLNNIKVAKIRVKDLLNLIKTENVLLLDVRPFDLKGDRQYIEDSVSLTILHLEEYLALVPKDRDLVVIDAFMKQSTSAAKYLVSKGYSVKGVLKGGISKWKKAGFPLVSKEKILMLDINSGKLEIGGFLKE